MLTVITTQLVYFFITCRIYFLIFNFFLFLKKILFIFRERGKEGESKKHWSVASFMPPIGDLACTQTCALTGNLTGDLLVHRPALHPLSHTSWDFPGSYILSIPILSRYWISTLDSLPYIPSPIPECFWSVFMLFSHTSSKTPNYYLPSVLFAVPIYHVSFLHSLSTNIHTLTKSDSPPCWSATFGAGRCLSGGKEGTFCAL